MATFTFAAKADTKFPLILPLTAEDLKKPGSGVLDGLTPTQKKAVSQALGKYTPKSGKVVVPVGSTIVVLHILGKKKELKARDIREAGAAINCIARTYRADTVNVLPGSLEGELLTAYREGAILGTYDYTEWKGKVYKEKMKDQVSLKKILFTGSKKTGEQKRLTIMSASVGLTKDIINCPPEVANPDHLDKIARDIAKDIKGVKVTIMKEKDLKKAKCNAILAVGRGSHVESRLIVLQYKGGGKEAPIALVGKGVTYDTGGLSLKPSQYMVGMKQDLGGAATVLGAFHAIAAAGVKQNVIAVVPTVENTVNSHAYKPDDIIRAYNGVTVEVTNTDAEGRLILADALAYSADKYKPRAIVDLATLTGACAYAVGNDYTAALGTEQKLIDAVLTSGTETDEPVWQLPLHQRYKKDLESPIADIVNSSKMKPGTIEGGLFLQHFVPKDTPWCHLDIASVAFEEGKGATGRNVRMLWNLVETAGSKKI